MESSRNKVLGFMGMEQNGRAWDELCRRGRVHDLILKRLEDVAAPLSLQIVNFLCAFHNVRRHAGNDAAHKASQEEIHMAVLSELNSVDGTELQELYHFIYPN